MSLSGEEKIDLSLRTAEDFVNAIKMALRTGAFSSARSLSAEGVQHYPDHPELRKYAHLLAPPRVIRTDLPSTPSVKANRDWLKEHGQDHRGQWVALRDGNLVGVASSFDDLAEKCGETKGVLLTKVA